MAGKSCARLLVIAGFTRIHAAIDSSNPIREMTQCGPQRSLFRGLPAEC